MRVTFGAVSVLGILLLGACQDQSHSGVPGSQVPTSLEGWLKVSTILDLTHSFGADTIYWPTAEGFRLTSDFKGMKEEGYYYEANSFCAAEHGGTHLDAPLHFAEGRWSSDQIPVERLIGPAVTVDVSAKCAADRDYEVAVVDFEEWEKKNGRLPEQAIVLIYTGFGRYWPDPEKYLGTSQRGEEAVPLLHFPGLSPKAAEWLVQSRSISALGLDTASIDPGQSKLYQVHRTLFAASIPAFENVAGLDRLPAKGFSVFALPMKIKGGSGGPLRIIAVVPPAAAQ